MEELLYKWYPSLEGYRDLFANGLLSEPVQAVCDLDLHCPVLSECLAHLSGSDLGQTFNDKTENIPEILAKVQYFTTYIGSNSDILNLCVSRATSAGTLIVSDKNTPVRPFQILIYPLARSSLKDLLNYLKEAQKIKFNVSKASIDAVLAHTGGLQKHVWRLLELTKYTKNLPEVVGNMNKTYHKIDTLYASMMDSSVSLDTVADNMRSCLSDFDWYPVATHIERKLVQEFVSLVSAEMINANMHQVLREDLTKSSANLVAGISSISLKVRE